jgi:integrase
MLKDRMLRLARQYVDHRRRLGFIMRQSDLLLDFARFADRIAAGQPVTTALALRWARLLPAAKTDAQARRIETVRGFARYCAALDTRTEVPPARVLGPRGRRLSPHIYTSAQIRLILRRAGRISARCSPLAPQTYATLLGLIACSGLRIGEAVRLRRSDFDAGAGTLLVPRSKFSPERLLPLHPSAVRALARYQRARQRLCPLGEHFFVSRGGRPLDRHLVHQHFRRLVRGIRANGERRNVRVHDLRHTFATRLIARWSRAPAPVAHYLLLLSRYLGHQSFSDTWWYVSADARALAVAARQFAAGRDDFAHDPQLVPPADSAVLRRASAGPAQPQRPHGRGLPRYLPPAPRLPRAALAPAR